MSDPEICHLQCQLCGKLSQTKEALVDHLNRHLDYRKYPCKSCKKKFFTESEREEHCEKEGHDHVFNTESKPYCEMMLATILKDNEFLKTHDIDVVIAGRRKCNAELEKKISEHQIQHSTSPKQLGTYKKDLKKVKPSKAQKRGLPDTIIENDIPQSDIAQEKRRRVKNTSVSSGASESKSSEPKQPVPQYLNQTANSDIAKVACGICKKDVEMGYVARKDHVSKSHLGSNHTDEDYINLLETAMKRAFADFSYSDVQCQECQKVVRRSRRNHVYDTHVLKRIECPIENCTFSGITGHKITKHLKNEHNLMKGHQSIENLQLRSEFEQKFKKHNGYVENLVDKCFPCAVPAYYHNQDSKKSTASTSPQLLTGLRERLSQKNLRSMPLRRLSESSDSNEGCSTLQIAEVPCEGSDNKESPSEEVVATEISENDGRDAPLEFATEDIKSIAKEPSHSSMAPCLGTEEFSQAETETSKEMNKANEEFTNQHQMENTLKNRDDIKAEVQLEGDDSNPLVQNCTSHSSHFPFVNPNRSFVQFDEPTFLPLPFLNRDTMRDGHYEYASISRPEVENDRCTPRRFENSYTSQYRERASRRFTGSNYRSSSGHSVPSRRNDFNYERPNDYGRHSYSRDERDSTYKRDDRASSYNRDGRDPTSTSRHNNESYRFGGPRPLYTMRSSDR